MWQNWLTIGLWICCVWSCMVASWDTICEGDLTNFEIAIVLVVIFVGAPAFAVAGMLESIIEMFTGGSDDDGSIS